MVVVKPDPWIGLNKDRLKMREEYENLESLISLINKTFDGIKNFQTRVKRLNNQTAFLQIKNSNALKKAEKLVNLSIDSLFQLFLAPKGFEGYDHVTVKIVNALQRAAEFIQSSDGKLSDSKKVAVDRTSLKLKEAVDKCNYFLANNGLAYLNLARI